jgi:hypothetical protein
MPFPALIPSSRLWIPGTEPTEAHAAMSGAEARVRTGSVRVDGELRLSFIGISESEMLAIDTHAEEVGIVWRGFTLPGSVFDGLNPADFLPNGYQWIYLDAPEVEDYPCGGHIVSVIFGMVPVDGVMALGADLTTSWSITTATPVRARGADLATEWTITNGEALPRPPISGVGADLVTTWSIRTLTIKSLDPVFDYDFSDESTVTLSGTEITAITSKGSRAWTLTKSSTGPQYVTGINGRKCVDWGAAAHSRYLRNTDTTETTVGEIWVVLDANLGSAFGGYYGLVTATVDDTNANEWFAVGYQGLAGFDEAGAKIDQAFVNGSATNTFASVLPAINSPCILRLKRSSGVLTLQNGVQIGNDRDNPNRGWGGLVGRVIGFPAVLDAESVDVALTVLSSDWGITIP